MTHDENRISDLIDGGLHDKSAIDRAKYELHLRRIAAIEEAAKNDTGGWYEQQAFIRGAQHVIEHPERYGLVPAAHTAALQERVKELEGLLTIWVKQNNYLRRHSISDFDEVHDQTKKTLKK